MLIGWAHPISGATLEEISGRPGTEEVSSSESEEEPAAKKKKE